LGRINKTVAVSDGIIVHVTEVDIRQLVILQPFTPLGARAIAPITGRNQMIRIERLQVATHLSKPGPALFPTTRYALRFVHQFITEDGWIVAVENPVDGVAPRRNPLEVRAIEFPRRLVGIKLHRLLDIDAKRKTVVVGAVDAGPTQVLGDTAGVAPPVRQAELYPQIILRSFGQNLIEKNQLGFIPFAGAVAKRMGARPVIKIGDRFDVVRATFTRSPNPHNFDSQPGGLAQSLRHARAIFIAIHHRDIGADEAKGPAIDDKSSAGGLHKAGPAADPGLAPTGNRK